MNLESKFKKIWNEALPLQDKRDDEGHAKTVTYYAQVLLETEVADKEIVIPAAILHDIGWSKCTAKEIQCIFDIKETEEKKHEVRTKHQEEGVKLTKEILKKLNYNKEKIPEILRIISIHDTGEGYKTKEEAIMRDADKLWRFTEEGIKADIRRNGLSYKENKTKQKKRIDKYFFTESGKNIAQSLLTSPPNRII